MIMVMGLQLSNTDSAGIMSSTLLLSDLGSYTGRNLASSVKRRGAYIAGSNTFTGPLFLRWYPIPSKATRWVGVGLLHSILSQ